MLRPLVPLAVVLALGLSACGDDEPQSGATTDAPIDQVGSPVPENGASSSPVVDAVIAAAPALESAYRGAPYPQDLDEAVASLPEAGVTLPDGIEIGGYTYDPDAVEFVLCLQDDDGAWASYDTAPMGVRDSGDSGGCPSQ